MQSENEQQAATEIELALTVLSYDGSSVTTHPEDLVQALDATRRAVEEGEASVAVYLVASKGDVSEVLFADSHPGMTLKQFSETILRETA